MRQSGYRAPPDVSPLKLQDQKLKGMGVYDGHVSLGAAGGGGGGVR